MNRQPYTGWLKFKNEKYKQLPLEKISQDTYVLNETRKLPVLTLFDFLDKKKSSDIFHTDYPIQRSKSDTP